MSKRTRTPSDPEEHAKISRATTGSAHILCSLPPTCNPPHNNPTPLASSAELESHYANYHAHVCEQPNCRCVFPEPHLLELHQTECHDPIAAVRKDRGEKIFACLVQTCPRLFLTPKARRLHLIQAHAYPKQFFFSVTNKGIGGLLKRWGDGASMIRAPWKPRDTTSTADPDNEQDENDDNDEVEDEDNDDNMHTTPSNSEIEPRRTRSFQDISSIKENDSTPAHPDADVDSVDQLARSMTALSLVPPSIRFGRGGKNGGFVPHHRSPSSSPTKSVHTPAPRPRPLIRGTPLITGIRGRGAVFERGRGRGPYSNVAGGINARRQSDQAHPAPAISRPPRGRGGLRGRGRGRGFAHE